MITNAIIVDYTRIYKVNIGIRDGQIAAIGKRGNPLIMDGVDMIIGASPEVIAAEGMIVTAGGTGHTTGTNATSCSPGEWNIYRVLEAAEEFPMNLGFLGKGKENF